MKKMILSIFVLLVIIAFPSQVNAQSTSSFIESIKDDVIEVAEEKNVYASLMMAQAILESGNGDSSLAKYYNNFFGMKGPGISLNTVEGNGQNIVASFLIFDTKRDSLNAYADNFYKNKAYKAFLEASSPDEAAMTLNGVYATSNTYGQNLISIMRAYNLYELDDKVADYRRNKEKKKVEFLKRQQRINMLFNKYKKEIKAEENHIGHTAKDLYLEEVNLTENVIYSQINLGNDFMINLYNSKYYSVEDIMAKYKLTRVTADLYFNKFKNLVEDGVFKEDSIRLRRNGEIVLRSIVFNYYMASSFYDGLLNTDSDVFNKYI